MVCTVKREGTPVSFTRVWEPTILKYVISKDEPVVVIADHTYEIGYISQLEMGRLNMPIKPI